MALSLVPAILRHKPQNGAEPDYLVAVLHGVGSSAASMSDLVSGILGEIPCAAVVAPDGPNAFDGAGSGWQWFSVSGVTDANRPSRISAALPPLRATLERELERVSLGWDRLAVVGFSQGAMMALALAAEPDPPFAVAAIAGRLASRIAPVSRRRPPVLVLHGVDDSIVPVQSAEQAVRELCQAGFFVQIEVEQAHGHGISGGQVERVARHLSQSFALWPEYAVDG